MGTVAWSCIIFAAQARQHERIFIADFDLLSVTQLIESKDTTQDTLCRVYLCISSSSLSFAARISLICDIVKSGGKSKTRKSCSLMGLGENGKKRVQCDDIEILKELLFCLERKNSVIQLTHNRVTWLKNYKASQEKKRGKRLFRQILTKDSIRESSVQRI